MPKEHMGRNLLATGLTIAGVALGLQKHKSIQEQLNAEAHGAIPPIVEHLSGRYGVDLALQISEYERDLGFPFEEPLPVDSLRAARVIQDELSILPPDLVKKIGPKRIVLSDRFGYVGFGEMTGFTFPKCAFVYISTHKGDLTRDNSHRLTLGHDVQHEFHHVADASDDIWVDDQAWNQLSSKSNKFHIFGHPGFISEYAQAGPNEDQAEIAALLFKQNTPQGREAYDQIDDPIVLAKVEEMKRRYEEWSDGLISDQYWIDLRAGIVGEAYWNERDVNRD